MARHNTCVNPALTNDNAGWGGGSTPARAAVVGFGRPFGARYTSGTFANTARGAVAGDQPATLSAYAWLDVAGTVSGGVCYVEWRDASQAVITYASGNFTIPGRSVSRIAITATAPSAAAFASMIVEFNFGGGQSDFSQVLIEPGSELGDYFDGDSPDAVWDGVPGNSSSTLQDIVTAVLNASLPPFTTASTGALIVAGSAAAALPALAAAAAGDLEATGAVAATLPSLAASANGTVSVPGELDATLPAMSGAFTGQAFNLQGQIAARLPAFTASLTGTAEIADSDIKGLVGAPELGWQVGAPYL